MENQIKQSDLDLWKRLVESYFAFASASKEFLNSDVSRVFLIRRAIGSGDRAVALYMADWLSIEEKLALFDEWVFLASFDHGAIQSVRELILSLPRDWVLEHIQDAGEKVLCGGDSFDYRRLLELYLLLDRALALVLARRALTEKDEEIQEVGQEFLSKLTNIE